jgi:hypothetical protein
MLLAAPAAILGWLGVDPGLAAPLAATAWGAFAWLRLLWASPVG